MTRAAALARAPATPRLRAALAAALAVAAVAAVAALGAGCNCAGFNHSVDDDYGCDPGNPSCAAGRVCVADPASALGGYCVVAATDAGADSGADAGADSGSDAAVDSGADSGSDAGADSGADAGGCPADCSALTDQCNVGVCDVPSGTCVAVPASEGAGCDDGLFCTAGETCASGACAGGVPTSCSDLNDCTTDACDEVSNACANTALPDGAVCAAGGGCIVGGTCQTGVCTASVPAPPGTPCTDGDPCSTPDVCDNAGACLPGATVDCTGLDDVCNVGACDPASGLCQALPFTDGTECRAGAGVCDVAEGCSAGACPADAFATPATTCRAAAGPCDLAESCSGTAATCPADAFATGTTVCRAATGVCDVPESCTGSAAACPADALAPPATTCRPTAGGCDVAESCSGVSAACPADGFAPPATACRPAAGTCDLAESCTGTAAACPADAFEPATTTCRATAGACDVAETCTGSAAACPADAFATPATTCRPTAGPCDVAESCTGSAAACPADAFATPATTCRPTAGPCDVAESCSGSAAACPADAFATPATTCRASAGACDPAEVCTGSGAACPADLLEAPSTVCRAASELCDVAEFCTGVDPACPGDGFEPAATPCRAGAGFCDVAEACTGTGPACPADAFAAPSVVCRAAAGMCDVAENCTGSGAACPADALQPNGTPCDDGLFCTSVDTCTAGACGGPSRVCPSDGLFCNGAEVCDEGMDACVAAGNPCPDDAFSCTIRCDEPTDACDVRDETACAVLQICNPVEYSGTVTGCGAVPTTLTVNCPASGTAGAASTCVLALDAGAVGIDGEAARIACVADPMPVTMFRDDFNDASLDAPWTATLGTPTTDSTLGTAAASAFGANWAADVTRSVAGLNVVCVDFDVAQANADNFERIRWDVAFDAGAFATVFDLNFFTWEGVATTFAYNRNVCVSVPGGASTVTWRLRLDSGNRRVWVDNVVLSGLAAPYTVPANGGPDDMGTVAGWSFLGGGAPYIGVNGGSSAMFAEGEMFTATRGVIDASACDVLDVDFDFGFSGTLDAGDDVRLQVSVDGGAFTDVEFLDLAVGAWNVDDVLLPWFGLRRVTATVPGAAGAASVVFRFTLEADDAAERVWVDNFVVRCADLAAPVVGAVVDTGAGGYSVSLTAPVPEDVLLTCVWATTDDGPLTATDTESFLP